MQSFLFKFQFCQGWGPDPSRTAARRTAVAPALAKLKFANERTNGLGFRTFVPVRGTLSILIIIIIIILFIFFFLYFFVVVIHNQMMGLLSYK